VPLDVRTPAGMMFMVLGTVLMVYGAISDPAQYDRTMGLNVNLGWGIIMALFGAGLLLWRRFSATASPRNGKCP
jgi:hypothetical protein